MTKKLTPEAEPDENAFAPEEERMKRITANPRFRVVENGQSFVIVGAKPSLDEPGPETAP